MTGLYINTLGSTYLHLPVRACIFTHKNQHKYDRIHIQKRIATPTTHNIYNYNHLYSRHNNCYVYIMFHYIINTT